MNEQTQNTAPAAEPRKSFIFYLSWAECMKELEPMERLAVYEALIHYAQTGETPPLQGVCKMAFSFILRDYERADTKYQYIIERRRAGGRNHKGNQYTRKMEHNGTEWNSMELNGTNGTVDVDVDEDVNVDVNVDEEMLVRAESAACAATNEQRRDSFFQSVKAYMGTYPAEMLRHFATYWSEPTPDGTKMRFELERTWSLPHRLRAWQSREPMKARASPNAAAQQREQEARERERQYRQRLAREEAERERKQAEQRSKAVFNEEQFERMKARFNKQ